LFPSSIKIFKETLITSNPGGWEGSKTCLRDFSVKPKNEKSVKSAFTNKIHKGDVIKWDLDLREICSFASTIVHKN
jgi:hypothetical protein